MGGRGLPAEEAMTTCGHPGHYAKGLCASCYKKQYLQSWVNRRKADCHPDRPHYAKGLCISCYNAERYVSRETRWRKEHLVEEVEHGTVTFWNAKETVGILGYSLCRALQRAGRQDLVKKLGGECEARRADAARREAGN